MTICVDVDSGGYLREVVLDDSICSSFVLVHSSDYVSLGESELAPADIAYVFSWGFGAVVVLGYFGGYFVGIAKKIINKI